jgi:predicted CxxxxCH...CXXCH cytochrome family protein
MRPAPRPTALLLALLASGCFIPRDQDKVASTTQCIACHGSAQNEGTDLEKAAPPTDTRGNTSASAPGVGAHANHLRASATHAPVACTECHRVPTRTADPLAPDHDDGSDGGRVVFGRLATADGGLASTYDPTAHTCANVYCHGPGISPVWTEAVDSAQACGTCHGVPPPVPHVQLTQCGLCHAQVMQLDGGFKDRSLHVNGTVEVRPLNCSTCHGHDDTGAPPPSLNGSTTSDARGVGAHAAHLGGIAFARDVACADCHRVPTEFGSPGHINGTVEVAFPVPAGSTAVPGAYRADTLTCTAWCHTPQGTGASPAWTSQAGPLGCTGCHGAPPPPPHLQVAFCPACHRNVQPDGGFHDKNLHVNGAVDVVLPTGCVGCHGSGTDPAPPTDTLGNTSTTALGVGAHQQHLTVTWARKVPCGDCHTVPTAVVFPNHLNGVADVQFSGVATTFNVPAAFDPASHQCTVYCHDASAVLGFSVGASVPNPIWNQVNGGQAFCGSCHGVPPPSPHPNQTPQGVPLTDLGQCVTCHFDMGPDGGFVRPDLHVDGRILVYVQPPPP